MSWEARQQRLKTLFGEQESLCLQVFCEVSQKCNSPERFDELVEKHGFTAEDVSTAIDLPRPIIGEIEFNSGLLINMANGEKRVREVHVEPVFTSTNRNLIKQVQGYYKSDDYICLSNPVLDEVMAKYIPEIERQLPQLDFEGNRYADVGSLYVEFQFGIQPYDFDLHPPHDMDVLKPITVIEGHVIRPSVDSIEVSSLIGAPVTTLKKFNL